MLTKFSSLLAWAALASAGSFQPRAVTSLNEAATAEAHQRDNDATRALSDVRIKTSDGRCLFVDKLSGDFRANLTPVQVATCGSTDGQGWDIITKGTHISGDNVMLIVSTLTQACFNFDERRALGNQVLLFSCGGRADGGGAVTDSQVFPFNGSTGPLSLTPQNKAGSCLTVKGNTVDIAGCSVGDASQSFTFGNGDTNGDLKAKRTNKKASSSTSCTKRTRTVVAAAASTSRPASVSLPASEAVLSSSAAAQTTESLPDIDLSAAGTGKFAKNKKAKKPKSSTGSGAITKAAEVTTSAIDTATASAIVNSLSEVDLSTEEGTATVTSAATTAKFTKKGKKVVKTKSTKVSGVATTVVETATEAVTDGAASSTGVTDITTTSASAQITESPSSVDLGIEDETTTITGAAGTTTKVTRKGKKGKKTKSSKTTAASTASVAVTDQVAASTTAADTSSVAATASATGATTSSAAAVTGGAGGILSANPTTPVPVSRAGGTLQPSAAAEAHQRDGTATRAFSNVSIRAPNGQCLFIDPTAGDFRQNLIPVSIVDCTGAPNEKWDIITAGKHNSATKATLVVSTLTQGCISFDGRRNAGDTVTLFSCGGRADGSGGTNSDQIFRYLGQLSFAFAPIGENNKTCILPGDAGRLDSGPCPTDGSQLYSIFP